jgi:hypothetical protein
LSDIEESSEPSSDKDENSGDDDFKDDNKSENDKLRCVLIDDEAEEVDHSEAEREDRDVQSEEEGEGEWIDGSSPGSDSQANSHINEESESEGDLKQDRVTHSMKPKPISALHADDDDDFLLQSPEKSRPFAQNDMNDRNRLKNVKKSGAAVSKQNTKMAGRLKKTSGVVRSDYTDSDDALLETADAEDASWGVPLINNADGIASNNSLTSGGNDRRSITNFKIEQSLGASEICNSAEVSINPVTDVGSKPPESVSSNQEADTSVSPYRINDSPGQMTAHGRDSLQVPVSVTRHRGGGWGLHNPHRLESRLYGDEEDLGDLLSQFETGITLSPTYDDTSCARRTISLVSPPAPRSALIDLDSPPSLAAPAPILINSTSADDSVVPAEDMPRTVDLAKEYFRCKVRLFASDRADNMAHRLSFVSSDDSDSSSDNALKDVPSDSCDGGDEDTRSWSPHRCIPEQLQDRPYDDVVQRPRLCREYNAVVERALRLELSYRNHFGGAFPMSTQTGSDEESAVKISKLRRIAELYLKALEICDSDAAVHAKLFILGQVIGAIR